MKKIRHSALLTFCSALVASASLTFILVACSSDDSAGPGNPDSGASSSGGSSGTTTSSSGTDGKAPNPPAPTLGAQVDRMGRPAINTATNNTFNADSTSQGTAKDGYNANKDPSTWEAQYKAEIAKNLGIYDALDTQTLPGDGCGNQLLANASGTDNVTTYGVLAGVLADDRLYLNTASTTCETYLGVELKAVNIITTDDCGGRTLKYDVIKSTYGAVSGADGFDDGIDRDTTKTDGTTFPYLAAP